MECLSCGVTHWRGGRFNAVGGMSLVRSTALATRPTRSSRRDGQAGRPHHNCGVRGWRVVAAALFHVEGDFAEAIEGGGVVAWGGS